MRNFPYTEFSIHYHIQSIYKPGPLFQAHIGTSLIDLKEGHNNCNNRSLPNYFHLFLLGR